MEDGIYGMPLIPEITVINDIVKSGEDTLARVVITGLVEDDVSISWKQGETSVDIAQLKNYSMTHDGLVVRN